MRLRFPTARSSSLHSPVSSRRCCVIYPSSYFLICWLFSLLAPPPPTSTLFPYTTLFRSHSSGSGRNRGEAFVSPRRSRCQDRKSTRLNSSHLVISYAVFCLKKKNLRAHACIGACNSDRHASPLWRLRTRVPGREQIRRYN